MKHIFTLFTILLLTTIAHADEPLTSDVVSGWGFNKSLKNNYKDYGYELVNKDNEHPVRSGNQSLRFEVRSGDCGYNTNGWSDCDNDRERHELSSSSKKYIMDDGEYWFGWSLYLPNDFNIIYPTKSALGQFHQKSGHVIWMFQNHDGGYWVDNQTSGSTIEKKQILSDSDMRGKWNDIAVHAKWTHKSDGFFKIYINGASTPTYEWIGPTKSEGKKVYFKFGIYRSFMQRWKDANNSSVVPTQIAYFDEVRRGDQRADIAPR